jgi:tetratricopeptide (TPR) repeat protein
MSSRACSSPRAVPLTAACLLTFLSACSSPAVKPAPVAHPAVSPAAQGASQTASVAATPNAAAVSAGPRPDASPVARADFDRALRYMRAGNATEAELGFKQVALQYPQFAAPLVDLGLLQRKQGELEQSEASLKGAVGRESTNALAWTELGVTQRMRGRFKEAAQSYEQAIAADPRYAPAWRNLGVLSDLYLGDPQRALKALEQYKSLTGEDKPVNSWIAELRQRLGIKAPDSNPAPVAAPTDAPGVPAPAPGAAPTNAAAAPAAPKAGG